MSRYSDDIKLAYIGQTYGSGVDERLHAKRTLKAIVGSGTADHMSLTGHCYKNVRCVHVCQMMSVIVPTSGMETEPLAAVAVVCFFVCTMLDDWSRERLGRRAKLYVDLGYFYLRTSVRGNSQSCEVTPELIATLDHNKRVCILIVWLR